jgi:hypothetical protein
MAEAAKTKKKDKDGESREERIWPKQSLASCTIKARNTKSGLDDFVVAAWLRGS